MRGGDNPLPPPKEGKEEEKEGTDGGVRCMEATTGVNQCVVVLGFEMRPKYYC